PAATPKPTAPASMVVGFGVAAGILSKFPTSINTLFIADAMTFALAAVIILGIPNLGGGLVSTSVSGAVRRAWSLAEARPHLVISTLAAFLIPISLPAVLALAY